MKRPKPRGGATKKGGDRAAPGPPRGTGRTGDAGHAGPSPRVWVVIESVASSDPAPVTSEEAEFNRYLEELAAELGREADAPEATVARGGDGRSSADGSGGGDEPTE